jgi:hypothetical protein
MITKVIKISLAFYLNIKKILPKSKDLATHCFSESDHLIHLLIPYFLEVRFNIIILQLGLTYGLQVYTD